MKTTQIIFRWLATNLWSNTVFLCNKVHNNTSIFLCCRDITSVVGIFLFFSYQMVQKWVDTSIFGRGAESLSGLRLRRSSLAGYSLAFVILQKSVVLTVGDRSTQSFPQEFAACPDSHFPISGEAEVLRQRLDDHCRTGSVELPSTSLCRTEVL